MLAVLLLLCLVHESVEYYCRDQTFSNNYGTLQSPSYPRYPSYTDCKYTIKVNQGKWIKLSWNRLAIDGDMPSCSTDYVQVSTGCYSKRVITRLCSNNMNSLPHDIYSYDNCMEIKFHSDGSGTKDGFRATYQSYSLTQSAPNQDSSCSNMDYVSRNQVITSPNWPLPFKRSNLMYRGYCKWEIDTHSSSKVIKLNFMDVNLGYSSCSSWSNPVLKVEEEKSYFTSSSRNYYYCSKTPFSLANNKYYEIDLELKSSSDLSSSRRGFAVGVLIYNREKSTNSYSYTSSRVWVVGLIVGIVFFFVLGLVIYRRHKYRMLSRSAPQAPISYSATSTNQTVISHTSAPPPQPNLYQGQGYIDVKPPPYPGPPSGEAYPYAPPPPQGAYPPPQGPYPPPQGSYPPPQEAYPPPQGAYPHPPPQGSYPPPSDGQPPPPSAYPQQTYYPPPAYPPPQ